MQGPNPKRFTQINCTQSMLGSPNCESALEFVFQRTKEISLDTETSLTVLGNPEKSWKWPETPVNFVNGETVAQAGLGARNRFYDSCNLVAKGHTL